MVAPIDLRRGRSLTRRIVKALSVFGSVEALSMLCNVVRTKLLALWTGTAGVGVMGLLSSALEMLTAFTQLALGNVTVRYMASAEGHKRESIRVAVVGYGLLLACCGGAVTVLLSPLLSILTFGSLTNTWAFAWLAVAIAVNALSATQSAVLQANGMLGRIAWASMIGVPLSLAVAVLMLYYFRINGILPVIIIHSVIIASMLWLFRYRARSTSQKARQTKSERNNLWIQFARLGIFISLASAVTMGANYLLLSYINHTDGAGSMGLCQAGYSMSVRYVGIVFTAMAMEYYPRIAGVRGARSDTSTRTGVIMSHQAGVSVAIIFPCALIMIFIAPWLVELLYSSRFADSVPMIILAAAALPLRAWSWSMGFVILAGGDGRIYLITEVTSAIVGLVLNIWGYHIGGLAGLGLSFVAWYAIYSLMLAVVLSRTYNIHTSSRVGLRAVCASAILLAVSLAMV